MLFLMMAVTGNLVDTRPGTAEEFHAAIAQEPGDVGLQGHQCNRRLQESQQHKAEGSASCQKLNRTPNPPSVEFFPPTSTQEGTFEYQGSGLFSARKLC